MNFLIVILFLSAVYLYASFNLAILISRKILGTDIRETGTGNAGSANIGRNLGTIWALPVFLFDISKSLLPLFAAQHWIPGGGSLWLVLLTALAAILGHCRPLYYHFRGGGGIVTSMGVLVYLVPAEFMISLIVSFIIVTLFLRKVRYRFGQWIPIVFLALTPVLTLSAGLLVNIPIAPGISLGGKPWYYSAAVLSIGITIMLLNRHVAGKKAKEFGALVK